MKKKKSHKRIKPMRAKKGSKRNRRQAKQKPNGLLETLKRVLVGGAKAKPGAAKKGVKTPAAGAEASRWSALSPAKRAAIARKAGFGKNAAAIAKSSWRELERDWGSLTTSQLEDAGAKANPKADIAISGRGFYQIVATSKAGTEWMDQVEGFDGKRAHTDSTDYAQGIADGAAADGLRVTVNGKTYKANPRKRWKPAKQKKPARVNPRPRSKKRCRPKRRNSGNDEQQQAGKLYQKFHGKKPSSTRTTKVTDIHRTDVAKLGDLILLAVENDYTEEPLEINFEGTGVIVASSPDGRQLYFVGGDQDISAHLAKFKVPRDKDLVDLGDCVKIHYYTRKKMDNFLPVEYMHDLGEETEEYPRLMFNQLSKGLHLIGGAYKVKPEGIVN